MTLAFKAALAVDGKVVVPDFTEDSLTALKSTKVKVPHYGNDRARDNWEPLFAIAQVIGGDWPRRAQAAFTKLAAEEEEAIGPMLLSDIREVLEGKPISKIWSRDLVDALIAVDDRPWCEWKRGKPMTQNSLAKLLQPYRIHPSSIRVEQVTRKGYRPVTFTQQTLVVPSPGGSDPERLHYPSP